MPYVTCPECDHESLAPRELIGLQWACPKCDEMLTVTDGDRPVTTRRRKRNSAGPWIAAASLGVAGVLVFGILAFAVSRASRPAEPRAAATPKAEAGRSAAERADRTPVGRERPAEPEAQGGSVNPAGVLVGLGLMLFGVLFYFTPTIVALARGHNNVAPIVVVNFFLGWLLVGWVIALAWAFTDLKHLEHRRRSYL